MGYGDPLKHIDFFQVKAEGNNILARFRPNMCSPGRGDEYFGIYRNSKLMRVYFAESNVITDWISISRDPGHTTQFIVIISHGFSGDPANSFPELSRKFELDESQRITARWPWQLHEAGSYDDTNAYTSNWDLSGLEYDETRRVKGWITRGVLDFDLAVSGGNVTVTVRNGQTTLATGTAAVGGTVTLAESNSSGVSGSVDVAAGVATTSDLHLLLRWPESMKYKRDSVSPPTTVRKTVNFNEIKEASFTEESDLSAGTYYVRLQPVSDTGDDGDESSITAVVVPGTPEPPTNIAYSSGNAAATVVSWTASATAGATYNIYVQQPGGCMDFDTPTQTEVAGSTQTTLPAISPTTGTAYVVVKALHSGVESRNRNFLALEYDSGAYVAPRPNDCTINRESEDVTSGRSLSIKGTYDSSQEEGTATQLQLFTRTPSGSYNFASPDNTANLDNGIRGVKTATLSYTFASNGHYYITMKAVTAGGVQSLNQAAEIPVFVSDANIEAQATFDISIARA